MPKIAITFKADGKAKNFMKQFSTLGLATANASAKGNKVIIDVSDPEETKVVRSLINDVKEHALRSTLSSQLVESIKQCIKEDKARSMRLRDGSMVRLTPARASAFAHTHDTMSEQTQTKMRRLVIESSEAFKQIMDFCKQRSKPNGDK